VSDNLEDLRRVHELLASYVQEPAEVLVDIETDRSLFVSALLSAGYRVFAVNPFCTSRIESATRALRQSPIPEMPRCSPISCGPTRTTTARSPGTQSSSRR
jgi:hypothetical protein